ncbi:MAG: hypothetical protein FD153_596 [Rhodospirillaceae bacterium]|nr:MAG: hypothetical protein FD153_596 [Rhodospirillaceae bacterium]
MISAVERREPVVNIVMSGILRFCIDTAPYL